jgi:hypothetical protein
MFYNYFKIVLLHLRPKASEPGEVIKMIRSIDQQSHAFTREFQSNLLSNKNLLKDLIPGMKIDPFERKEEAPIKQEIGDITGTGIIQNGIMERRRIVNKKRKTAEKNEAFYH